MMILTKPELYKRINESKEIRIEPILEPNQIDLISVDLRLDNIFGEFQLTRGSELKIDPKIKYVRTFERDFFDLEESYYLHPNHFILGQTFEYIVLPKNIRATLDGRSSLGRRGIVIHVTAGSVDPGFEGHLVLELANVGKMPYPLYPLMKIGRITFEEIEEVEEGYVELKGSKRRQITLHKSAFLKIKDVENIKNLSGIILLE